MQSIELEQAIAESELILSRSGYTTLLDLSKMEKKAFFIPTPGQFEQEYLAQRLDDKKISPSCTQDKFTLDELKRVSFYSGFKSIKSETNFEKLFRKYRKLSLTLISKLSSHQSYFWGFWGFKICQQSAPSEIFVTFDKLLLHLIPLPHRQESQKRRINIFICKS